MRAQVILFSSLLLALLISGCGQKGPLYFPEPVETGENGQQQKAQEEEDRDSTGKAGQ